jgi:hypothetical protein
MHVKCIRDNSHLTSRREKGKDFFSSLLAMVLSRQTAWRQVHGHFGRIPAPEWFPLTVLMMLSPVSGQSQTFAIFR